MDMCPVVRTQVARLAAPAYTEYVDKVVIRKRQVRLALGRRVVSSLFSPSAMISSSVKGGDKR
jgi:hypothetical protein